MQIIQNNNILLPSPVVNIVLKNGETLIACLFVKVGELTDSATEEETDISGFSFENLSSLLPENKPVHTIGFPEQMCKVFSSVTLGAEVPGLYCLMSAVKFTKNDPTNKAIFDMKGPQLWSFEFTGPQLRYTRVKNLNPHTAIARDRGDSYFLREHVNSTMTLLSPFEDSTLDECTLFINTNTSFLNTPNVVIEPWVKPTFQYIPVPKIIMDSAEVKEDTYVTGSIQIQDYDGNIHPLQQGEVFLEATAGYLTKSRYLVGSDVKFKIGALGLEPGNVVRVKAGWRNYYGLSEAVITVI